MQRARLAGRGACARRHSGHQLQVTNVVYIRVRVQAKLCDRSKDGGGIVRFDLDRFGSGAAADLNLGKFRGELFRRELTAHFYEGHNRELAMRPHQVADKFSMSVRRLRDLIDRDPEMRKHLLDDRVARHRAG